MDTCQQEHFHFCIMSSCVTFMYHDSCSLITIRDHQDNFTSVLYFCYLHFDKFNSMLKTLPLLYVSLDNRVRFQANIKSLHECTRSPVQLPDSNSRDEEHGRQSNNPSNEFSPWWILVGVIFDPRPLRNAKQEDASHNERGTEPPTKPPP